MSNIESRAICILGMHRSGTSTITRAINLLGAYLGEEQDLIPPAPDNPEGFWERCDVVALHDRILEGFKRTPDIVSSLPHDWHTAEKIQPLREELRGLIHSNFSNITLWAWKDPRTCVLFDLWKQLLSDMSIGLSCVFMVRNPLDVAKSLKKRNDMPYSKSFGFWLNSNLAALEASSDVPTVFVSYDDFVDNWGPELRRIADLLKIQWPTNDEQLKKDVACFVQPGLRHNQSKNAEFDAIPAPVRELYHLILEQTKKQNRDQAFYESLGRLSSEYRIYSSFFDFDMDHLFDRGKRLLDFEKKAEGINGRPEVPVAEVTGADAEPESSSTPTMASRAKRITSIIFGR